MTFSPDCQFLTELPQGYDERATLALGPHNEILLVHPDMRPLVFNEQTRKFEEIRPCAT